MGLLCLYLLGIFCDRIKMLNKKVYNWYVMIENIFFNLFYVFLVILRFMCCWNNKKKYIYILKILVKINKLWFEYCNKIFYF